MIAGRPGRHNVKLLLERVTGLLAANYIGKHVVSASVNPHFIITVQGDGICNPPHTESSDSRYNNASVIGVLSSYKTKSRLDTLYRSSMTRCVDLLGETRGRLGATEPNRQWLRPIF